MLQVFWIKSLHVRSLLSKHIADIIRESLEEYVAVNPAMFQPYMNMFNNIHRFCPAQKRFLQVLDDQLVSLDNEFDIVEERIKRLQSVFDFCNYQIDLYKDKYFSDAVEEKLSKFQDIDQGVFVDAALQCRNNSKKRKF